MNVEQMPGGTGSGFVWDDDVSLICSGSVLMATLLRVLVCMVCMYDVEGKKIRHEGLVNGLWRGIVRVQFRCLGPVFIATHVD